VDTRAHGAQHNLRAPNGHQVLGPGGFYGRMDQDSAAAPGHSRALEHVFDGSFTLNGAGGGIVLISPKGDKLLYVIQLHFCTTKNVAGYEALVNGLCITTKLRVQQLYICGDSEVIVNQVMGESN
jgi:hypothetical protein